MNDLIVMLTYEHKQRNGCKQRENDKVKWDILSLTMIQ